MNRRWLASAMFVGALVVLAAVLHRPLRAWFTGKSSRDAGEPITMQLGPWSVEAALEPDPPGTKDNTLLVEVRDASGKPVDDATLELVYDMPAMATMPEMKGSARVTHEKGGRYRAVFDLPMGGSWPLTLNVRAGASSGTLSLSLTVGSKGLTKVGGSEAASEHAGEIDHYTCSMHPSVKQQGPGKCPICGMDLVPVTKDQQEQGIVTIDETRRQLIGVRTAPVTSGPMRGAFRAVGRVTYDEASLADVNLKVRGWITQLQVNQTGQRVASGQTLFTMYSPELYNAQQDFLLALQASQADALRVAARQRLRLLGMSDAQIDAVAKKGTPAESVTVPSPASGFVIEKNVVEGASVDPGMRLFRIAALDRVWIEADVYEADLAHVRAGQPAKVTLDYLPGRFYEAKVAYVYPYLEAKARTGRVRVVMTNRNLELRPGMYASVSLGSDVGTRVQVPAAAVVYTGPRRLVFIDAGQGRFRPQEIHVGAESDGMFEVLDGVQPGDIVATSGVFLIAAEARISTAAKYWESHREASDAGHADAVYTCPMHPEVKSSTPGKCPKCGMDLEPMEAKP